MTFYESFQLKKDYVYTKREREIEQEILGFNLYIKNKNKLQGTVILYHHALLYTHILYSDERFWMVAV
jgi:hypothetical protein